jgi:dTDP-4-dehydrorhamnose 3,5-epimerase
VSTAPRHYILRTSWVIGDGKNFVRTMASLAERGIDPKVVDDQRGRLTFASEIARAVVHLLDTNAPYGTYNVSGAGDARTWKDIASDIFAITGADRSRVSGVSTAEYFANAPGPVAPRPLNSVLDLSKLEATGFVPRDAGEQLEEYLTP